MNGMCMSFCVNCCGSCSVVCAAQYMLWLWWFLFVWFIDFKLTNRKLIFRVLSWKPLCFAAKRKWTTYCGDTRGCLLEHFNPSTGGVLMHAFIQFAVFSSLTIHFFLLLLLLWFIPFSSAASELLLVIVVVVELMSFHSTISANTSVYSSKLLHGWRPSVKIC